MSLDAEAQNKETGPNQSRTAPAPAVAVNPKEIYELLGFATMTGEDPLRMWTRLRETSTWLVGPLAPDSWPGQVFIADHEDIFAFRFLSIPAAWMKGHESGNRAAYCAKQLKNDWWRNWPSWWRVVGPKAWDDSYARLIWQMPDGGPEVTYEWARTAKNEVVCRITNSEASDWCCKATSLGITGAAARGVVFGRGGRRFLRGRSWVPGTRDGMRWVLAMSAPAEETAGTGSAPGMANCAE